MESITDLSNLPISVDHERLAEICRRYQIRELGLFGSVLRDDFTEQSDVDVLCTLLPDSPTKGMTWIRLMLSLEDLWGRPVDLVKPHLLDPLIRDEVLTEAKTIYVATP
ncbi:MAG: nucleotidyltransferase domain-containing protein [Thermaerobacter sp.]|nr:nucleotidyltransferase domain-containing protein [Thermaerobacter sp.]